MSEAEQEVEPSQSLFKGNAAAIALSAAIKSLGGFVGVYLPYYFVQIGGDTPTLGLLTLAAALVQLLFLPIGGLIADNYGRRRIIVSVAFFGVIFPIFYAVVQDWRIFGLLTVLAATAAVSNPATRATVVDSIPLETRTTGIATLQVISTLPSVISPMIGGWLIQRYDLESGFRMACIYAAVFSLVSAFPLLMLLRETLKSKARTHADSDLQEAVLSQAKPLRLTLSRNLIFLLFCYALVAFANGAAAQYYIFYALNVVGITPFDWGTARATCECIMGDELLPCSWFGRIGGRLRFSNAGFSCALLYFRCSRTIGRNTANQQSERTRGERTLSSCSGCDDRLDLDCSVLCSKVDAYLCCKCAKAAVVDPYLDSLAHDVVGFDPVHFIGCFYLP